MTSGSSFILVDSSACHSLGSDRSLAVTDQVNPTLTSSSPSNTISHEPGQQPQQQVSFVGVAGHHQPPHVYSHALSSLNNSNSHQQLQQHSPSSSSANNNSHHSHHHDSSSSVSTTGSSPPTILSSSTSLSSLNPYHNSSHHNHHPVTPSSQHQVNNNMYTSADYLAQLLKDQKQVTAFPGVFFHLERLLTEGQSLFCRRHSSSRSVCLHGLSALFVIFRMSICMLHLFVHTFDSVVPLDLTFYFLLLLFSSCPQT